MNLDSDLAVYHWIMIAFGLSIGGGDCLGHIIFSKVK